MRTCTGGSICCLEATDAPTGTRPLMTPIAQFYFRFFQVTLLPMTSEHFKTKSIESFAQSSGGFTRTLTASNLVLLGVGGIIGAGIFVLTGQAAAQYAGPAVVVSFILSGIACAFAALCYAELAAMIPLSGSAYTYAYATMGQLIAWIIGWDLVLEYLFGASTVAVGWSGYVTSFLRDLGINLPHALTTAPILHQPGGAYSLSGSIINLPAVLIIAACTALLCFGMRESAKCNNLIVLIKITVLLLFVLFGIQYVSMEHLTPFIPPNTGEFGDYGWSGIFRGAGVIFFAYIGFDSVSTLSQEAKNPQRDMPIGIIGALIISTVVSISVAFVLTGIVPYEILNVPDPIAVALNAVPDLSWLKTIIKCGAIAGLSSVVLVLLMSQPRVFYCMSRDGFLPPIFSRMSPKYNTPVITTIICGTTAAVIAGLFPIGILGELVSIGTLFAFFIVCLGVLILRKTRPELPRPFRCPAVHIIAPLGAGSALLQMAALPGDTWLRLLLWMALGLAIYFFYGVKRLRRI